MHIPNKSFVPYWSSLRVFFVFFYVAGSLKSGCIHESDPFRKWQFVETMMLVFSNWITATVKWSFCLEYIKCCLTTLDWGSFQSGKPPPVVLGCWPFWDLKAFGTHICLSAIFYRDHLSHWLFIGNFRFNSHIFILL